MWLGAVCHAWIIEHFREVHGKRNHGQHVQTVLFEDVSHESGIAGFQAGKITLRNFTPGKITFAPDTKNNSFKGAYAAVICAVAQKGRRYG